MDQTTAETSLEQVEELYEFLQGTPPKSIIMGKQTQPVLTKEQAFAVVWFLQEHMHLLPDSYQQCSVCEDLFDSREEGFYVEEGPYAHNHYCEGCAPYEVRWPDEATEDEE